MFDYENSAGTAFIKDRDNRLKSYEWTDTGIKFLIPDITRKTDLGKYEGEFETEHDYKQETVEIKEIFGQLFICLHYLLDLQNKMNVFLVHLTLPLIRSYD